MGFFSSTKFTASALTIAQAGKERDYIPMAPFYEEDMTLKDV